MFNFMQNYNYIILQMTNEDKLFLSYSLMNMLILQCWD